MSPGPRSSPTTLKFDSLVHLVAYPDRPFRVESKSPQTKNVVRTANRENPVLFSVKAGVDGSTKNDKNVMDEDGEWQVVNTSLIPFTQFDILAVPLFLVSGSWDDWAFARVQDLQSSDDRDLVHRRIRMIKAIQEVVCEFHPATGILLPRPPFFRSLFAVAERIVREAPAEPAEPSDLSAPGWRRCKRRVPVSEWREATPGEMVETSEGPVAAAWPRNVIVSEEGTTLLLDRRTFNDLYDVLPDRKNDRAEQDEEDEHTAHLRALLDGAGEE